MAGRCLGIRCFGMFQVLFPFRRNAIASGGNQTTEGACHPIIQTRHQERRECEIETALNRTGDRRARPRRRSPTFVRPSVESVKPIDAGEFSVPADEFPVRPRPTPCSGGAGRWFELHRNLNTPESRWNWRQKSPNWLVCKIPRPHEFRGSRLRPPSGGIADAAQSRPTAAAPPHYRPRPWHPSR